VFSSHVKQDVMLLQVKHWELQFEQDP